MMTRGENVRSWGPEKETEIVAEKRMEKKEKF